MPLSDGELIHKINQGDCDAFDALFEKHKLAVYRFAHYLSKNGDETEDLFQETWLRAVRIFQKKSDIRDVRAWLITITANVFKDSIRKKQIRRRWLTGILRGQKTSGKISIEKNVNVQYTSDRIELGMAISQGIEKLPYRQREVFVLKEIEGFKHKEIGKILGIPVGTVKSLLFRAVKRLQRDLAEYHD